MNKLFYIWQIVDMDKWKMDIFGLITKNIFAHFLLLFSFILQKTFLQKYTQQSTYYQKMLGLVSTGDLSDTGG